MNIFFDENKPSANNRFDRMAWMPNKLYVFELLKKQEEILKKTRGNFEKAASQDFQKELDENVEQLSLEKRKAVYWLIATMKSIRDYKVPDGDIGFLNPEGEGGFLDVLKKAKDEGLSDETADLLLEETAKFVVDVIIAVSRD